MEKNVQKAERDRPGENRAGKIERYVGAVLAVLVIAAAGAGCAKIVYWGPMKKTLHLKHTSATGVLINHKIALLIDGKQLAVQDRKTGEETVHEIKKTFMVRGVRFFILEVSDSGFGVVCGDGIHTTMGGFATMLMDVDSLDIGPVVLLKEPGPSTPAPNTYTQQITVRITDDPDKRGIMYFENMVIHEMTHVIFMDTEFLPKEGSEEYHFSETEAILSEMVYGHTLIAFERILTLKYFIDLAEEMGTEDVMKEGTPWGELARQVSEILARVMLELGVDDAAMIQQFSKEELRDAAARAMDRHCLEGYFSSSQSMINPSVYEEAIALCCPIISAAQTPAHGH